MDIADIYKLYTQNYLVSTDTRKIIPNALFFALKGENFNGNKFANEALQNGASYVIVDEAEYQTDDKIILVENVLETLQSLATYHRRKLGIPIVALTGSNGKTTTKELINAVLSQKFETSATSGNLNNHIGVPLTLLAMTPKTEIGVVEMGANHLKEIEFLCRIAEPDFGYITNFGKAHLEGFGSLEGVIQGKSELYAYLRAHKKIAFINANDSKQVEMSKGIKRISFGDVLADVKIELLNANPFVSLKYRTMIIQSHLIGSYNYNNIAAAVAIGNYFEVADGDIKEAIEAYQPTNNRSQIIEKGSNTIILDAYNANPSSMKVALENFSALAGEQKMVILGDMFELGKDALAEHKSIAELATSLNIDKVVLIGENFGRSKIHGAEYFKDFDSFRDNVLPFNLDNTTLLIKASRGMALERVLDLF